MDRDLDFDTGLKHSAVITDETNRTFEEILIQRILDKAFDERTKSEFVRAEIEMSN